MTRTVLDASVVLKWLRDEDEERVEAALALKSAYEAGRLTVHAPFLLYQEVLNVAGRRWRLGEQRLVDLAGTLDGFGFTQIAPDLERIAAWTAAGLSAYDASYVAVAEAIPAPLITDDARIVEVAPAHARPLAGE